jgi:hypothetical protein
MNKIILGAVTALALGFGAAQAQTVPGLAPVAGHAQDIRSLAPGAPAAPATLDAFKGLIGNWKGPSAAVSFSEPMNGQIVGHVVINDGAQPRVEELWIIRPEGNSVLVRQKHFSPDLKGREDRDEWAQRRLIAFDAGHIYLENLTWFTQGDTLRVMTKPPAAQLAATPTAAGLDLTMQRVR